MNPRMILIGRIVLISLSAAAGAQTNMGPIKSPQVNQNIFVGQAGYATIQSAINHACSTAPRSFAVVILPGMNPIDAPASIINGCAGSYISDQRVLPMVYYIWNGTQYTKTSNSGVNVPSTQNLLSGNGSGDIADSSLPVNNIAQLNKNNNFTQAPSVNGVEICTAATCPGGGSSTGVISGQTLNGLLVATGSTSSTRSSLFTDDGTVGSYNAAQGTFHVTGLNSQVNITGGNQIFANQGLDCKRNALPGDNGGLTGVSCEGFKDNDSYHGWNYGPADLSNQGWYTHVTKGNPWGTINIYSAGIYGYLGNSVNLLKPGDTQMLDFNVYAKPATLRNSDEGFHQFRLLYHDLQPPSGLVTSQSLSTALKLLYNCDLNCANFSISGPVLDVNSIQSASITNCTGAPVAGLGLCTIAGTTLPVSNVGTLKSNIVAGRAVNDSLPHLGTTHVTGVLVGTPCDLKLSTCNNSGIVALPGPILDEFVTPTAYGTFDSVNQQQTFDADVYYSHSAGINTCYGGAAGMFLESADETFGTNWQGTYSPSLNYSTGQIVSYNGTIYTSVSDTNTGNSPSSSPTYWSVTPMPDERHVQKIYCSPTSTSIWTGERVPQAFVYYIGGGNINIFTMGGVATGVNDDSGKPSNGVVYVEPGAGTWTVGHRIQQPRHISAVIDVALTEVNSNNPYGSYRGWYISKNGLIGGYNQNPEGNSLLELRSTAPNGSYIGTSPNAKYLAPWGIYIKGVTNSGISEDYWPRSNGKFGTGAVINIGGNAPGDTSTVHPLWIEHSSGQLALLHSDTKVTEIVDSGGLLADGPLATNSTTSSKGSVTTYGQFVSTHDPSVSFVDPANMGIKLTALTPGNGSCRLGFWYDDPSFSTNNTVAFAANQSGYGQMGDLCPFRTSILGLDQFIQMGTISNPIYINKSASDPTAFEFDINGVVGGANIIVNGITANSVHVAGSPVCTQVTGCPAVTGTTASAGEFASMLTPAPLTNTGHRSSVTPVTPPNSNQRCRKDAMWHDEDYIYVCIRNGQVKRTALEAFTR